VSLVDSGLAFFVSTFDMKITPYSTLKISFWLLQKVFTQTYANIPVSGQNASDNHMMRGLGV
jgi:hypothetical protein